MNELIKEFYRASRSKEALASQDEYKSADILIGTEIEKFAELIVKECTKRSEELGQPELGKGLMKHFYGVKL